MNYPDEILRSVKILGVLGYTTDKVINILSDFPSNQVSDDLADITSELFKAYRSGFEQRELQMSVKEYALMKKQIHLADLETEAKETYYKIRKDLFGI